MWWEVLWLLVPGNISHNLGWRKQMSINCHLSQMLRQLFSHCFYWLYPSHEEGHFMLWNHWWLLVTGFYAALFPQSSIGIEPMTAAPGVPEKSHIQQLLRPNVPQLMRLRWAVLAQAVFRRVRVEFKWEAWVRFHLTLFFIFCHDCKFLTMNSNWFTSN